MGRTLKQYRRFRFGSIDLVNLAGRCRYKLRTVPHIQDGHPFDTRPLRLLLAGPEGAWSKYEKFAQGIILLQCIVSFLLYNFLSILLSQEPKLMKKAERSHGYYSVSHLTLTTNFRYTVSLSNSILLKPIYVCTNKVVGLAKSPSKKPRKIFLLYNVLTASK